MDNRKNIEYYLEENELVCPEVLDLFSTLNEVARNYLIAVINFFKDEIKLNYDEIDIKETINLVREFLGGIDQEYLNKFNKYLSDGTFDLFLPEDDLYKRSKCPVTFPKYDKNINIPVRYNYDDGGALIHEFFHYLNDTDELVGVRDIFTEMISIYYEIRFYQFLNKKGYNIINFYYEIYDRIYNSLDSAQNLCFTSSTFDIYNNIGDITEEDINFIDKYRNLYTSNTNKIIKFYNSKEFKEIIDSFRESTSYTIGTLLTFFSLRNPKVYDIKMKYINENINELSIEQVLNKLDTKFEDYPIWIEECVRNLKKAFGEINEQNYSDSRTNRSR